MVPALLQTDKAGKLLLNIVEHLATDEQDIFLRSIKLG